LEIEGVSLVPINGDKYTYTLSYDEYLPWRNRIQYHSMNTGEYNIIGFTDTPNSARVYFSNPNNVFQPNGQIPQLNSLQALKTYVL